MRHPPLTRFCRCVVHYAGEHKIKRFSYLDQYPCMAFVQLTCPESLRDIESSLRLQQALFANRQRYLLGLAIGDARQPSALTIGSQTAA